MDGRRRLAEPVTDGAPARSGTGTAPGSRARTRFGVGRGRLERYLRRWLGPSGEWRLPRGTGVAAVSVFLLASLAFGSVRGGHWPVVVAELYDLRDAAANAVGFRITSIAMSGEHQLSREDILATAGITDRTSLLFLDASEARARLKANPWIADATVLKLYPSRLNITVTERDAFALWQLNGKITVISADGAIVDSTVPPHFAKLPLVVGVGAAAKAKELMTLLDGHPLVRDQMRAAVLVAERRWNLILKNGLDVRLPETDAEQALDTLAALDRDKKLLSRDITVVDLRLPDRVTVRLSDDAAAARQDALNKD
ncbi:MAG: FtsQ-type POTRA domain-containing protein, partial [Rhizobiales bacterium]|nr:FtsQ-type POTRA domain-containing protein [Hyphomicrobiales bacterium]